MFALTIFLGSFLLFQVQPIVAKSILPWFGGSSSVWLTCLIFFQGMLLAGYAYAHLLGTRLRPGTQAIAHGALLVLSLALLPIVPSERWALHGPESPNAAILGLLAATVGAPFFLLGSTAPLVQAWFARRHPGASPYRLYALSNAGSLAALLSYPVVVERYVRLATQQLVWSVAYGLFALLCTACALRAARSHALARRAPARPASPSPDGQDARAGVAVGEGAGFRLWAALAAGGSLCLLATTNQVCQNVAPVPFLWILPLSIYLVSYVLGFDHPRWYHRTAFAALLPAATVGGSLLWVADMRLGLALQVLLYSLVLFVLCMCLHGELARLRPAPQRLTSFYLAISLGGALGGAFVSLAAPSLFDTFWEYPLGLVGGSILVLAARRRGAGRPAAPRPTLRRRLLVAGACVGSLALAGVVWRHTLERNHVVLLARNFYGALRISERVHGPSGSEIVEMFHGDVLHGAQFLDPELVREPTAYFGPGSGVDVALRASRQRAGRPLRVGVIGLGAGCIAAYAEPGDSFHFYEINPLVARLAREHFRFLADAEERGAAVDVRLGDARTLLERELATRSEVALDLLVVDAFNGDSVPVHLLTAEAFEVYDGRIAPGGLLALHLSNVFLDLAPVARTLAEGRGASALRVLCQADDARARRASEWVLVADEAAGLAAVRSEPTYSPWKEGEPADVLWTDDFTSLLPILR